MDDTVFLHGSLPGWDVRVGVEPKGGHQREPCDYIGKVVCLLFICAWMACRATPPSTGSWEALA